MKRIFALAFAALVFAAPVSAGQAVFGTGYSNTAQATPTAASGTTSASPVAMGLGSSCAITPLSSGDVVFTISGVILNNTAGDGWGAQLAFGTGTPPASLATSGGTLIGNQQSSNGIPTTGGIATGFSLQSRVTGQTIGTALWFDLFVNRITGGTASVAGITCTAAEL